MKAINVNGRITIYDKVPHRFKSTSGLHLNARSMSDEELKKAGMFDLIIPEDYNDKIHDLSEIYFDSENQVYRKDKSNKTWEHTLTQFKGLRISHFKNLVNKKLQKTDWYIVRNQETSEEIPAEILEQRRQLRELTGTVESEINSKTTKSSVANYNFPNID